MRLILVSLALAACSVGCLAQKWEIAGAGGYDWTLNSSIGGGANPAHVGQQPHGAFSVMGAENEYNYIGGEFQYVFRPGGTQIQSNGITETASGYSNILVYDLTVHFTPRESKFRPFVAAGAGIKIYTNSAHSLPQPLPGIGFLTNGTQVEPALSFDGGVKYMLPRHVQLRLDFRAYASPAPHELIRLLPAPYIRGWMFDLMPMVGVGYIF